MKGFGYLRLSVTGADISSTLDALTASGVHIAEVNQTDDLTVRVLIQRRDHGKMTDICRKRGDNCKILDRGGVWFRLRAALARPVLLVGLLFLLGATVLVPTRVFFVRVEGNDVVPTRLILEAAERCGIGFGASRRNVRSERVKNALLDLIPQLQWTGVNTRGCVATITVRERIPETTQEEASAFGHIVAAREGVVTSCTALSGTLLCAPGQAVTEGEVLISGYTDCGLHIRAEQAKGEVYARTMRQQNARIPISLLKQGEPGEQKRNITLIVGKKRINLWKDSGIWDTICDRMYEEYYVTLPGGFQLPLALAVDTYQLCDLSTQTVSLERAQRILGESCQHYLRMQMVAGTILESKLDFTQEDGCLALRGQYVCTEMIGKMQRQQIGENNGKSD